MKNVKMCLLLLVVLLAFFTGLCAEAATEMPIAPEKNWGFETFEEGIPNDWTLWQGIEGINFFQENTIVHSGESALKIQNEPGDTSKTYATYPGTNTPNSLTQVTGYLKIGQLGEGASLRISLHYGAATEARLLDYRTYDSESDWKEFRLLTNTASTEAQYVIIQLEGEGTVYVDSFNVCDTNQLFANGSFEKPGGFSVFAGNATTANYTYTTDEKFSGDKSLKLTTTSDKQNPRLQLTFSNRNRPQPGVSYRTRVLCLSKNPEVSSKPTYFSITKNSSANWFGTNLNFIKTINGWDEYVGYFTVPDDGTTSAYSLVFGISGLAGKEIYFDDITLEPDYDEDVEFYDSGLNKITQAPQGSAVIARSHVVSGIPEADGGLPVTAFIVVYSVNGDIKTLEQISTVSSLDVYKELPRDVTVEMELPTDATKTYIAEAFKWDGFASIQPYGNKATLTITSN